MNRIKEVLDQYPDCISQSTSGYVNSPLIGTWFIKVDRRCRHVFLLETGQLVYGDGYQSEESAIKYLPYDRYIGKALYHHKEER